MAAGPNWALCAAAILVTAVSAGSMDPIHERAARLVSQMNITEKLRMLQGASGPAVGNTAGCKRLGIPGLHLEDGPNGVADSQIGVTDWPTSLTIAASWDVDLLREYGQALAKEQRMKGMHVMLGPGLNLARAPQCGRNFEYLGEDPFLTSVLSEAEVNGIQTEGVIACAKHFIDNNQEGPGHNGRLTTSSQMDSRTQWELYYRSFEGAIRANVGSIMCSYNLINGTYACMNRKTLSALKTSLGFKGFVVSDWGADHNSVLSLNAGMDMSMSSTWSNVTDLDVASNVTATRLDDAVIRILQPMIFTGILDHPERYGNASNNVTSPEADLLARKFAEESTILLKNDASFLPLDIKKKAKIAVVGDANTVKGGGSGSVNANYIITPTDGIVRRARQAALETWSPASILCSQASGYMNNTFFNGFDLGNASAPFANTTDTAEDCCDLCASTAGCAYWSWNGVNDPMCYPKTANAAGNQAPADGHVAGPPPSPPPPTPPSRCVHAGVFTICNHSVYTKPCGMGQCNETRNTPLIAAHDITIAKSLAEKADIVVVNVATTSTEGYDRDDLSLGTMQNSLVETVANACKSVVVVVRSPGAVEMPWVNHPSVKAVILQLLPGQEAGNALAAVLFGDINPSAKLPVTFPHNLNDTWITSPAQYPGLPNDPTSPNSPCHSSGCNNLVYYTEGLFMGYKWYDHVSKSPLFPFGFGLSYTTFEFDGLHIDIGGKYTFTVNFNVSNSGSRIGAEVAQVYVTMPDPNVKQLKGFKKVLLKPAESQRVSIEMSASDLSIWNTTKNAWDLLRGHYVVHIGSSVADIRLNGEFQI